MILPSRLRGRLTLVIGVASCFSLLVLIAPQPSRAGSPLFQLPAGKKVETTTTDQKVERPVDQVKVIPKMERLIPGGPAQIAPNSDALIPQFLQQFRPILTMELRLMTTACNPSPTQRREIALDCGKAIKESARKMATVQIGVNVNRVRAIPPRQVVAQAILDAARSRLSPDQFDRYQKEVEARAKEQREAVMLNVVANLDKLLILSTDQREKLGAILLARWDEQAYPSIESVMIYEGYHPPIPPQDLNPILDPEQTKIWMGATKIQYGGRNFALHGTMPVPDDEDVKAALAIENPEPANANPEAKPAPSPELKK